MVQRSQSRLVQFSVLLVCGLLLAACGAAPGPGASAPGSSAPGSSTTGSNGPGGSAPIASSTPLVSSSQIDGLSDFTALTPPPDPESGPVPPPEPATKPVTGQLGLGAAVSLAQGSIDSTGGSIKVAKPGDPLDGLTITAAAGTYTSAVSFSVSEHSISPAASMVGITPISPLISIDNGGVITTGDPLTVTVPVTVPAGAKVLALYYHGKTGAIDPLPIVAQDASSVTFAASHFSDVFLAQADPSKILPTVDSGFRPGVDDWEFTNYGSFVATNGHCEGQSVSEIWYYESQRQGAGASPLYGLYDNNGAPDKTPTLWQDDSSGYRFVSSIQASPISVPAVYNHYKALDHDGALTYDLLWTAIGLSGEPQLVTITDAAGGHGHAIVAYRVTPTRVYVADPNYPGHLRTIAYDAASGVLGPYSSGDNAGSIAAGGGVSYTHFSYVPSAASASDEAISAAWAEFEANKSGDAVFPAYSLEVWTGLDENGKDVWEPLDKSYQTSEAKLRVRLVVPSGQGSLRIYRGSTGISAWNKELTVDLKDGLNDLGFYEMGVAGGSWKYVNFLRIAVTKGEIDINGTWTGTLTFTEINADAAAEKEAKDQGCDLAIIEALRGKVLPMTLELTADKEGVGEGVMTIDASAVVPSDSSDESSDNSPKPVTLPLKYAKGVISFDFGDQCGKGNTCAMTGTPTVVDKVDTITGTINVTGTGYSAKAEWTVTRDK